MRQRGRRSAVDLATIGIDGKPPKLQPPPYLNQAERQLFVELIGSCAPSHFVESDLPLLASFVQATLLSRGAARDPKLIGVWEKAVRVQATLATRLRLAPQSRVDPKTLTRQLGNGLSVYDEMRLKNDRE